MPPPPRRRKRSSSKRFISAEIEITPEISDAIDEVRADSSPFNWMVCGYETERKAQNDSQRLVLFEKGMVSENLNVFFRHAHGQVLILGLSRAAFLRSRGSVGLPLSSSQIASCIST